MSNKKKMLFREFMEMHATLMPAISFAPGSTAFFDVMRSWNTIAILFPEKCADVVVYGVDQSPTTMKNDINIKEALKTLETKPMENLPDNLRSKYNPQKMAEQRRREQEKKKDEQAEKDAAEKAKKEEQAKKDAKDIKDAAGDQDDNGKDKVVEPVKDDDGTVVPTHAQGKTKTKGGRTTNQQVDL